MKRGTFLVSENITGLTSRHTKYTLQVCNTSSRRSTAYLDKLAVTHLVNKFPAFMKTEYSLPCSQKHATSPFLSQMNPTHNMTSYFFTTSTHELDSKIIRYDNKQQIIS